MGKRMVISGSAVLIFSSFLLVSATKDNNKKGFDVKAFDKSLCCIPKGSFMVQDSFEMSNHQIAPRSVEVDSFYMCNHVVSNMEYRIFLDDLKSTEPSLYSKMLPDTLVWRSKSGFPMEDMVKYYFNHPSYSNYPVVGVSHEQAEYYCKWLTEKYRKEAKRKYKKVVFKLPSLYQWDWAAYGGNTNNIFPFGLFLRNSKGLQLANYLFISEQFIKRVNDTGKLTLTNIRQDEFTNAVIITSPVISYWPNGYGLYNMAGNVEEYVAEVGITKGGSWSDPAYYLQIWVEEHYKNAQSTSNKIGFRVAMEVVK